MEGGDSTQWSSAGREEDELDFDDTERSKNRASAERMRSSSYLSFGVAVIILLVLSTAMEAEAIRLDAETRASVSNSSSQMAINKPNENVVKGSASSANETKTSAVVAAKEVRAVAHKLPEFHEDYYGPSDHSPRHH
ncbi:hypothetical protein ACQ4PT_013760 [Festuca glaucescens]